VAYDKNVTVPLPDPPGPWVDDERCICGDHFATYAAFNSRVTFGEASQALRQLNQSAEAGDFWRGQESGGFRSRGPVLHMMRVMKLERWYEKHATCPEGDWDWDQFCDDYPDSYTCAGYGAWVAAGRPEPGEDEATDAEITAAGEDWEDEIPF